MLYFLFSFLKNFKKITDCGERERKGERKINPLSLLSMHSLVDSCICPDQGSNPHPWRIRTTHQPTELPSQGLHLCLICVKYYVNFLFTKNKEETVSAIRDSHLLLRPEWKSHSSSLWVSTNQETDPGLKVWALLLAKLDLKKWRPNGFLLLSHLIQVVGCKLEGPC